ncbi:hypothetical protein FM038_017605 [Shewanella eurypsychrophilus]|uniref:Uncharacterized protein n=1 Tax=Shewanella eurypsychrophilus TaxID=2593656 RepID=A0ABX6V8S2_9GAMM|nr:MULTISPECIES: hypothetical protein [Shewanella]QFU23803.1 hypothetical protein FS418_19380 [Shewanella sp. YLB-09]QPG59026.1 hypothetical protein FM038_017605 [Shewanella eurypsychrophilus]
MQINSNAQQVNGTHTSQKPAPTQATSAYQAEVVAAKPLPNITDSVTLSAEAITLSKQPAVTSKEAEVLPSPTLPNNGEKAENYVEYRKAKAQYQIYSDMAGMATGNSNSISPVTAYYVSNNDEAREALVSSKAQQQQVSTMQTYVETTQSIYEQA